jgi:hypothetical protein
VRNVKSKVGEHSGILVQSEAFSYIESSRTHTIMKPQRNLFYHVPCNLFVLNFFFKLQWHSLYHKKVKKTSSLFVKIYQ